MTAFSAVNATASPTAQLCTPVAVTASSDTINGSDVVNGGTFVVITGGTPTNVTFTDPGKTPAGTVAGTVTPVAIAANTARVFGQKQLEGYINPTTGLIAVQFSATTSVTALFVR